MTWNQYNKENLTMSDTPLMQDAFSYAEVAVDVQHELREAATDIRQAAAQVVGGLVTIGKRLESVSQRITRDQLERWTRSEFGWTHATTAQFRRIAYVFGDVDWAQAHAEPDALKILTGLEVAPETHERARQAMRDGRYLTKAIAEYFVHHDTPAQSTPLKRIKDHLESGGSLETAPRHGIRTGIALPMEFKTPATGRQYAPQYPRVIDSGATSPVVPQFEPDYDEVRRAVLNMQVAMAEAYGVPLAQQVRRALSRLQNSVGLNHAPLDAEKGVRDEPLAKHGIGVAP
jgi:hypothetical protein